MIRSFMWLFVATVWIRMLSFQVAGRLSQAPSTLIGHLLSAGYSNSVFPGWNRQLNIYSHELTFAWDLDIGLEWHSKHKYHHLETFSSKL